ncbi:CPC_1213 family protein [Clostridium cellulovorans]|uniref:Uncharacterized protein n=1 Tax=Clostridium cellulovorans (strain ATCC 35296 / DSM 3052 / OCM 3 / 743B) TaxID=573061 RepID=D9SRE3_CLOC7|nr:CPC_1213 family protein [Clostridium cellulovorans]ADL52372.1 hypothetical protein Clocel_2672 [Clostridium cellulovorans 743B]
MPKMNKAKEKKQESKNFKKKHINHDPNAESARAAFGEPKAHDADRLDFKL